MKTNVTVIFLVFLFVFPNIARSSLTIRDIDNLLSENVKEQVFQNSAWRTEATIMTYQATPQSTQWIGISWGAPEKGLFLALTPERELQAKKQTQGIKSIDFFSHPVTSQDAVVVTEEAGSGTGYYETKYVVYGLHNNEIVELWEHVNTIRDAVIPKKYTTTKSYSFNQRRTPTNGTSEIIVEGIRKTYPMNEEEYKLKKLKTRTYQWDAESQSFIRINTDSQ